MAAAKTEKETDSTVPAITSKVEVLAIGDANECCTIREPVEKYNNKCSPIYFGEHLRQLLVGKPGKPIKIEQDWSKVDHFAAASIKKDNQPRQYHFYYGRGRNFPNRTIISGPTFNAYNVMEEVRKRLSKEKWISRNVIETPLTQKSEPYYGADQYIQHIVSESLNAESNRLFKFVIFLHREHMK